MLKLHEAAEVAFNKRATVLLAALREFERSEQTNERFRPDLYVVETINEDNIKDIPCCRVVEGVSQKLIRLEIFAQGKCYRLDDCRDFEGLAVRIATRPELRKHIGVKAVEDRLVAWFRDSIQHGQRHRFIDFLLPWLEGTLRHAEVWVPVANLHLESELEFGDIVFRPVTPEQVDDWTQALSDEMSAEEQRGWEKRIRKRIQGHAAAVCQIKAEPESAFAVATMLAEEAVSLLRLVGGAIWFPRAKSPLHLRGREHLESSEAWIVEPGRPPHMIGRGLVPFPEPVTLSDEARQVLQKQLDGLSSLLAADPRSDLQEHLIRALRFYSRSSLTRNPGEKLLLIVTALEILLLRDEGEPIQQSIGERLAFCIAREAEERMKIAALVRRCYAMRSRWVHHGKQPGDLAELETFMQYVFRFFLQATWAHADFRTKTDLLHHLELVKFSAGPSSPHRGSGN